MTKAEVIALVHELQEQSRDNGWEAASDEDDRYDGYMRRAADETAAKLIAAIEAQWG